ncbi:MAG: RNA polymerase sigma factor [Anaerolineae bacterium]
MTWLSPNQEDCCTHFADKNQYCDCPFFFQEIAQDLIRDNRKRFWTLIVDQYGEQIAIDIEHWINGLSNKGVVPWQMVNAQFITVILQNSWITAIEKVHTFEWRGRGSFYRWLFGIAMNKTYETMRQEFRSLSYIEFDEEYLTTVDENQPSFDEIAQDEMFSFIFMRLIQSKKIRADGATFVMLHHLENWTVKQLAQHFNRSEDSVKKVLQRTRKAIRREFEALGWTSGLMAANKSQKIEVQEEGNNEQSNCQS